MYLYIGMIFLLCVLLFVLSLLFRKAKANEFLKEHGIEPIDWQIENKKQEK